MVLTGNLLDVERVVNGEIKIDEIWYIVRSLKPMKSINGVVSKHISLLSPSTELFYQKEQFRKKCQWSKNVFDIYFKPKFIEEIKANNEAVSLIKHLATTEKRILLVCYCSREDMCHRSIIKELIDESTF